MTALLTVSDAIGGYGETTVLHTLNLSIDEGEAVGLVGPNGHGKTTLLNHISGLLRLESGSITFAGNDISRASTAEIVEAGFIHVAQGSRLFPECTVEENLQLGSYPRRARSKRKENLERVFELFPRLLERRTQLSRTLSGGERQMLAIGVGLMSQPRLLVLDEPTLGLAPSIKLELARQIGVIREQGMSLLVIDGDLSFVLGLTDRWDGVESGRVVMSGSSHSESAESEIVDLMFGRTHDA
jgi:branched-chain amino acid transport system ATP-binding protein